MASKFERVITDENVPDVTSHVLLKEILGFIVVAEKQMHELVVAWKRVKNILIKSILDVRRAAFPVGLIKMTSNILTEVQRANTLGNQERNDLKLLLTSHSVKVLEKTVELSKITKPSSNISNPN